GEPAKAGLAIGCEQFEMIGNVHGRAYGVTNAPCSTGHSGWFGPILPPKPVDGGETLPHKSAP
ncbi:MAG: hypothetical protein ACRED3_16070, partial [Bradyrhizobium sp.]